MIGDTLFVGLALLFPGAAIGTGPGSAADELTSAAVIELPNASGSTAGFYQLVIERQLIIRIPARPSSINNFAAADAATGRPLLRQTSIMWREAKAPKCVPMRTLVGIQAVQRDSIDLVTQENQLLRAKLNRGCRALDFYSGFYMKASKDGRLCAERDALHSRSGSECEVSKFRLMVAIRQES